MSFRLQRLLGCLPPPPRRSSSRPNFPPLTYHLLNSADSSGSRVTQSEAQKRLLAAFTGMYSNSPITELLIASSLAYVIPPAFFSSFSKTSPLPTREQGAVDTVQSCNHRAANSSDQLQFDFGTGGDVSGERISTAEGSCHLDRRRLRPAHLPAVDVRDFPSARRIGVSSDPSHRPPASLRHALFRTMDSTRLAVLATLDISAADRKSLEYEGSALAQGDIAGLSIPPEHTSPDAEKSQAEELVANALESLG